MDVTTVIIVKGGMINEVYSTLQSVNHVIELIDLDSDVEKSPEEKARIKALMDEVTDSAEYHLIY